MPTFARTPEGQWKARSPLSKALFGGALAQNRLLAGAPDSADEIADWDTYAARNGAENIYVVPKARAPVAPPTGTPVKVRVAVWAPPVSALPATQETRLLLLEDALFKAANQGSKVRFVGEEVTEGAWGERVVIPAGPRLDPRPPDATRSADVLVAPEYLFNLFPSASADKKNLQPCSVAQRDMLVQRLIQLSVRFPKMVIIPGTIIWLNPVDHRHYNSTYVIHAGDVITSLQGSARYDKCLVADYERKFMKELLWGEGAVPYFDFVHPGLGLSCRLQICADHGVRVEGPPFDLQLVTATNYGVGSNADTQRGGYCVHVDGCGMWRCIPAADKARTLQQSTVFELLDLVVMKP